MERGARACRRGRPPSASCRGPASGRGPPRARPPSASESEHDERRQVGRAEDRRAARRRRRQGPRRRGDGAAAARGRGGDGMPTTGAAAAAPPDRRRPAVASGTGEAGMSTAASGRPSSVEPRMSEGRRHESGYGSAGSRAGRGVARVRSVTLAPRRRSRASRSAPEYDASSNVIDVVAARSAPRGRLEARTRDASSTGRRRRAGRDARASVASSSSVRSVDRQAQVLGEVGAGGAGRPRPLVARPSRRRRCRALAVLERRDLGLVDDDVEEDRGRLDADAGVVVDREVAERMRASARRAATSAASDRDDGEDCAELRRDHGDEGTRVRHRAEVGP